MDIAILGAGPTGLFAALTLARRGHRVTLVDRDSGPPQRGPWLRKGVMQFHHAHTFRAPVIDALHDEAPDVLKLLTAAGARIAIGPDGRPAALLCRRSTFETALRAAVRAQPGLEVRTGHVDALHRNKLQVNGIRVADHVHAADLVLDATGRGGRLTEALRPPMRGQDCGVVYVTRQYRLRDGADEPPTNSPIGLSLAFARYFAIAFLHDDRTFSVTFAHDGRDARLRDLRNPEVFEHAVGAIPLLADWIEPGRSMPISDVLPGGRMRNAYRGQVDEGVLANPGLIAVGDAVCTTTPLAGRGVALALLQAQALTAAITEHGTDIDSAAWQFEQWCTTFVKPWFDDQLYSDADRWRRWGGGHVDLTRPLPSDLVVAAADSDPELQALTGPYARMDALPASLAAAEPMARAKYAGGWRVAIPDGPTHAELAELCRARAAVSRELVSAAASS